MWGGEGRWLQLGKPKSRRLVSGLVRVHLTVTHVSLVCLCVMVR